MHPDNRLWGWLSPDEPDLLSAHPAIGPWIAGLTGLPTLPATPPTPIDATAIRASRFSTATLEKLAALFGSSSVSIDPLERVAASLGQSYPDQILRRSGRITDPCDGVLKPVDPDNLMALFEIARQDGFRIMASAGATNVVGAFETGEDARPLLAVSLTRLNRLIEIDTENMTVTVEAGMRLADLESQLAARGLMLGHFPQSFDRATVGGSLMAHGSGQGSARYGRIGQMLVSARLATPAGIWSTEAFRHGGAGPWLGGLAVGSEGLFGILTQATLKIRKLPETIEDRAYFLADFEKGADLVRSLSQAGHGFAMLRLSDPEETAFYGALRLHRKGLAEPPLLERLFTLAKNAPTHPALLIASYEGDTAGRGPAFAALNIELKLRGGVALGKRPGASWRKTRFEAPQARESLLANGLGIDTFETAAPWSKLAALRDAVQASLHNAVRYMAGGDARAIVFSHLSHAYPEGGCLYTTAIFPAGPNPLEQWRTIKSAANHAIVAAGGTISHHHGMGAMHAGEALAEKSELGASILRAIRQTLDPDRLMASGSAAWLDGRAP